MEEKLQKNRKQEVAEEYIKEKVLNKDLLEIQDSLNELKGIVSSKEDEKQKNDIFGLESTLNILFNNKGKQRNKLGYEINKLKTINYHMMSEQSKSNLDLLYNELEKAESKEDLKNLFGKDLDQLKQEIESGEEQIEQEENIESFTVDETYIYNQAKLYGVTDRRQIAYILATVKGECNFENTREKGGEDKRYGKNGFYGRGYVQLTHKGNYRKFTKIIKKSGLKFKNNNGEILTEENLDLVKNPDTIIESNDLAAFILVYGMKNGTFTGKKLSDFINDEQTDFYNARSIINGMSSSPKKYEAFANEYLDSLEQKNNSILIGPEIIATNTSEFGGLGNSMMEGFQGYQTKSFFENMYGDAGKNTSNHPNRFKSIDDVKKYKIKHPGVKSFVLYFGANTKNNEKTLSDIKQWSNWLQEEGIQPILSTCIGEDNNPHLIGLNTKIKKLGTELDCPVLDFASSYKNNLIAMGNNQHPTVDGYRVMKQEILQAAA